MIGLAITTTEKRKDVFNRTYKEWLKHTPKDIFVYVHNDKNEKGVAYSKNQCLKKLYEHSCDDFFLVDDDCYPLTDNWWKPYVENEEPHLMYQFKLPNKKPTDMQELHRGINIVAYSHTRGAMIYVERRVLDVVGGFDTSYGRYGFEHADFTNRIHNAGLTTYRAMDVPDSDKIFYCLDQDLEVESNLTKQERLRWLSANNRLYRNNKDSKKYKEFRK